MRTSAARRREWRAAGTASSHAAPTRARCCRTACRWASSCRMAERDDALLRWCERAGIDTAYHDTWGQRHEASEAGLRALLAELGIADSSAQALAAAQESDWREPVPPVLAVP